MLRYLVIGWVTFATCLAQDAASLKQVADAQVAGSHFMGSMLVARDGNVLLDTSYGSANLEWAIANAGDTKFRIGSVTKQFTAAAVLLLEERGQLKLDDPVSKHVPATPAAWETITLFHLLTHTSGIASFTNRPEYAEWKRSPLTPAQIVERCKTEPLEFAPGERHRYSNTGYILLGYIIERVSGQSYETFVTESILKPLGLHDTGYDSPTILPHRAAGYVHARDRYLNAPYIDMQVPHAAGALYSTTRDLLRWQQGLFGGKVLRAGSLEKMLTPFKQDYALGLVVKEERGRKVISHGGGIEGFNAMAAYYPASKLSVIVLANVNGPTADRLAAQLAEAALGESTSRR